MRAILLFLIFISSIAKSQLDFTLSNSGNPTSVPAASGTPLSVSTCIGGSITFTAPGTTPPASGTQVYTFQWKKGANDITTGGTGNTLTLNNLTASDAGLYSVVLTSGTFSNQSNTIQLNVNSLPQGSLSANPICSGGTGQLTFTSTAGTGPFSLIVNNGTSNITYNDITSGTAFPANPNPSATTNYTLTSITDANGCVRTSGFTDATATIAINPLPQGAISSTSSFCAGSGTGQLTFTSSAGTGPFNLVISNGTTNVSYTNISSGTAFNANPNPTTSTNYTITSITDANGCVRNSGISGSATITVNQLPQGTLSSNSLCGTGGNPLLTFISSAGGTGPFNLIINSVLYTGINSGIAFQPNPVPTVNTPYTLTSATNPSTTCVRTSGFTGASTTMSFNTSPQGSLSANSICGSGIGQLTFTSTSGTSPFTLVINSVQYTNVVSGTPFNVNPNPASTTSYTLTSVTDANGCSRTLGFTNANATIAINAIPQGSLTGNSVCGSGAGQFTFTSTSGTGPFTLIISGQQYLNVISGTPFNANPNPSTTTNYTLTSITSADACTRTTGITDPTATITIGNLPQGSITSSSICGTTPGQLTFNASAGNGPFTLIISGITYNNVVSGSAFNANPPPTTNTTYTLTSITDVGGCVRNSGFTASTTTISVNNIPQGSLNSNFVCGSGTGQFTFTSTSGVGPFTLIINGQSYTNVLSGSPFNAIPNPTATTSYTLSSITDANGCSRTNGITDNSATITIFPLPQGSLSSSSSFCGSGVGQLTFTSSAGVGPFNLVVNGQTYSNITSGTAFNITPNPTVTTSYTLTSVTDANTCNRNSGFTNAAATVTITPALSTPSISSTPAPQSGNTLSLCSGNSFSLTASTPTGGNGAGTFLYTLKKGTVTIGSPQSSPTFTNNSVSTPDAGSYTITVTSGNCTVQTTPIVVVITDGASGGTIGLIGGSTNVNQVLCESSLGSLVGLQLNGSTGTTIQWQYSSTSNFTNPQTAGSGTTLSASSMLLPAFTGTRFYRAVVSTPSSACPTATSVNNASVAINPNPTISAINPALIEVCKSTSSQTQTVQVQSTGAPDQFSIDWATGLTDLTFTPLTNGGTAFSFTIPSNVSASLTNYNALVKVKVAATGCESQNTANNLALRIKATPVITSLGTIVPPKCSNSNQAISIPISVDLYSPNYSGPAAIVFDISPSIGSANLSPNNAANLNNTNVVIPNALNAGNTPVISTVTVSVTVDGCSAGTNPLVPTPQTLTTITVNPIPTLSAVADIPDVCSGSSTNAINLTSPTVASNITYDYSFTPSASFSIPNLSTGTITGNPSASISALQMVNIGNAPQSVSLTVTPTANYAGGSSCIATAQQNILNFSVNPIPTVTPATDDSPTVCSGTFVSQTNFTSNVSGATFTWQLSPVTPNEIWTGISNTSTQFVPQFTANNNSNFPTQGTISVKATANGCTSPNFVTYKTYSVRPKPTMEVLFNALAVANGTTLTPKPCNNASIQIAFASPTLGGGVSNLQFDWTNSNSQIATIAGSTNFLGFSGSGLLPQMIGFNTPDATSDNQSNFTVTPSILLEAPGTERCFGDQSTFTLAVRPGARFNALPDSIYQFCHGATTDEISLAFSPSSAILSWGISNLSNISNTPIPNVNATNNTLPSIPQFTANNSNNDAANPNLPEVANVNWILSLADGSCETAGSFGIKIFSKPKVDVFEPDSTAFDGSDFFFACTGAIEQIKFVSNLEGSNSFSWNWLTSAGLPDVGIIPPSQSPNNINLPNNGNTLFFTASNSIGASSILSNPIKVFVEKNGCKSDSNIFRVKLFRLPEAPIIAAFDDETTCRNTRFQNFNINPPEIGDGFSYVWSSTVLPQPDTLGPFFILNTTENFSGPIIVSAERLQAESGCRSLPANITINVTTGNSLPLQSDVQLVSGNGLICSNTDVDDSPNAYVWGYDDCTTLQPFRDETSLGSQIYFPSNFDTSNKAYWVRTQKDGCFTKSYYNAGCANTFLAEPLSINNKENVSFNLFPNPSDGIFNILPSNNVNGKHDLYLTDITGRKIMSKTLNLNGAVPLQLDISEEPNGLYILTVSDERNNMTHIKLIKN